jgi:hypothetical protein
MDILKNKMVMGGVVAVAVLALGYYLWTSTSSGPLLTDSADSTSPLSQDILATLGQLHTIRLDPGVFTDPVFVSLTDFGVTIPPQTAGRRNPFAPVGQQ